MTDFGPDWRHRSRRIGRHHGGIPLVLPLEEVTTQASASATFGLVILLLIRHVLQPRLTDKQRLAFDIAVIPLLSAFAIFIVADFMGALS